MQRVSMRNYMKTWIMKYNDAQAVSNWEIEKELTVVYLGWINFRNLTLYLYSTLIISIEKRSRYERATADCPRGDCGCGGVIDTPGQIIKSTNYPNNYDNGLDCRWLIEFDHACEIRLTVVDFELESGTSMPSNPCP